MSKYTESLINIMQSIAGHGGEVNAQTMCNAIFDKLDGCSTVSCDNCPFNSENNLQLLSIALDEVKET